ncbi:MAG TPA: hypothetical protein ENI05_10835 [Porticoccus sp.]|nr:hypothetical protein [Porticoccus sp.]
MSKKQLKRKNKRLKKENKQLWRDYKDLGDDYSNYVLLYRDVIGLLAKFDPELLLEVVKTTLLNSNETNLQTRLDVSEPGDTIYVKARRQYDTDLEESHADYDKAFRQVIRVLVDALGEDFVRATIDDNI